jgi:hypothetical protein
MKWIIIVDIDGTIARVGDRLKYLKQNPVDWDSFYEACFDDEPISEMIQLVEVLSQFNRIVFCTGRRESCREKTLKWIDKHFEPEMNKCSTLLMRKNDDHRHDTEVKPELLRENGIGLETIAFVLEDRNSMVKKWRDLGLICLQVAEGDF